MILLKQSRNGIHHRNASLLFFLRFLSHKTPRVHGVSLEGPTRAQLWADLEVNSQTKRGRKRKRQRGRGQRERGNPPFSLLPRVVSTSRASKRGRIHLPATMEGTHRGCCYLNVCVCVCGAALSRPLSGLIALEYRVLRAGSDGGGLLEGERPHLDSHTQPKSRGTMHTINALPLVNSLPTFCPLLLSLILLLTPYLTLSLLPPFQCVVTLPLY